MRKIDVHGHWNGQSELLDEWVADEREKGIDRVVVFDIRAGLGDGDEDQDGVIGAAERYPDFVIPFFNVDWQTDDGKAVEARRAAGFVGAKLILPPAPYDDDRFFDLYEGLARNGMVCLFHTAVVAGGGSERQRKMRPSSRWMRPVNLDRIARTFPEMPIIGAHIGYPWYAEACSMMRWHKNIYFDTSTSQLTYSRPKHIKTGKEIGAHPEIRKLYESGDLHVGKLLYGSDMKCPVKAGQSVTGYATRRTDAAMDDLEMPEDIRRKIYRDNAAAVLESAGIAVG